MPRDPMEGFDQAESEADERFYEERNDREKGDDDGVEYADPRDEQAERRLAVERRFDELFDWFLVGPRE